MESTTTFRAGYVSVVGYPNVGKSTFLNAMVGTKLSIVSPRPQTTRDAIVGILNGDNYQLVFVDTPGWMNPQDTFQNFMKKAVVRSIFDDADLILWLLEPKKMGDEEKAFIETLKKTGRPILIAVNKMDIQPAKDLIDEVRAFFAENLTGSPFQLISAKSGQGMEELKRKLIASLPLSQPYFPTDQVSDRWERFYVAEFIREQIFKSYGQEVPHASTVIIEEFIEKSGRKDLIKANIIVETEGQMKIIVGKAGTGVRNLGQKARADIENWLGRQIFLELRVKVHKNWRKDGAFLKTLQDRYQ